MAPIKPPSVDEFFEGGLVFIPHEDDAFRAARVLKTFKAGQDARVAPFPPHVPRAERERDGPPRDPKPLELSAKMTKTCLPMDEQSVKDHHDMVGLKQLNDAAILHNLRMRFMEDVIYTRIGSILVSVNPFKLLPIYTPKIMEAYQQTGSNNNVPHVYGVADNAYKAMTSNHKNQSCVVSGESGAGKTEATKCFLNYLAEQSSLSSKEASTMTVQQQILEANPLMEAFGNAKTTRNNNSSRFGKWIAITFDNKKGTITGGSITQYLLEKSRVVKLAKDERNYHIFYQLCAACGRDPVLAGQLKLQNPENYHYLNQGGNSTVVDGMDDVREFQETTNAKDVIEMEPEAWHSIMMLVSGILHLGNIQFQAADADAPAKIADAGGLSKACEQLGCEGEVLKKALEHKEVKAANETVLADYNKEQALAARDALGKTLYANMFTWVTNRVNESLAKNGTKLSEENETVIGVLDIFGFEIFENNSFEQLCINYCNEKLQFFFNSFIFIKELAMYKAESIDVTKITFVDNADVLAAFEKKAVGLFSRIDEEGSIPRGSDGGFLKKLIPKGPQAAKNRDADPTEIISAPDVRDVQKDERLANCFVVRHYAGAVSYNVEGVLVKNKDTLIADLMRVGMSSSDPFIAHLFSGQLEMDGLDVRRRSEVRGNKRSLGTKFKKQLENLMKTLNATEPHFIRCIKPNHVKKGDVFVSQMVLEQLRYSGLMEVCKIRQMGYPVRKPHAEFVERYHVLVAGGGGDPESLCAALRKADVLDPEGYQVGKTKVFMRSPAFYALEAKRDVMLGATVIKIQRAAKAFVCRLRYKNWKIALKQLEVALKREPLDFVEIEGLLYTFGTMPNNGLHIKVVQDGKRLMEKMRANGKALDLVKEALELGDMSALESAVNLAIAMGFGKHASVLKAQERLKGVIEEREVFNTLRRAIDSRDIKALKTALAAAKKFKLHKTNDARDAAALVKRLEQEEDLIAQLERAIDAKDKDLIWELIMRMVDYGLKTHPLVAEGEKVANKSVGKMSKTRAKEIAKIEHSLNKACDSRNLKKLNDLNSEVIRLGMSGPTVMRAKEMRSRLQYEDETLKPVEAEMRTLAVVSKSYHGVSSKDDLLPLKKAVKMAKSKGFGEHNRIKDAKEYALRVVKQMVVQESIKSALRSKDPKEMKKVAAKAAELGMETGLAKRIFAEVRQQTHGKPSTAKKSAKKYVVKQERVRLVKPTETERREHRLRRIAASTTSSDVFLQLLRKAKDTDVYDFKKFVEIREDEDYTRFDIPMRKKEAADLKLAWQKAPISSSILMMEEDRSNVAVRTFRSLLGWCGDASAQFPAVLAQDVLIRALEEPYMADEIYIQVVKQLHRNPRKESSDACWLMLCMLTDSARPSQEFELYLLNFLIRQRMADGLIGNYARLCITQLGATLEMGSTVYAPSLSEVQNYLRRPPVLARMNFPDHRQLDLAITPDMTVASTIETLAHAMKVIPNEIPKYGVFVTPAEKSSTDDGVSQTRGRSTSLLANDKRAGRSTDRGRLQRQESQAITNPLVAPTAETDAAEDAHEIRAPPPPTTPWSLPNKVHLGDVYVRLDSQGREPVFHFGKRLFMDTRFDPKPDKQLFYQLRNDVTSGALPFAKTDKVVQLVSLALAEKLGKHYPADGALIEAGLMKFVPSPVYEKYTEEEWQAKVFECTKALIQPGTTAKAIRNQYVGLCRDSKLYGMGLFYGFVDDPDASGDGPFPDTDVVVGVNWKGVHVLSDFKIFKSYMFASVLKFGATTQYLALTVPNKSNRADESVVKIYSLQAAEMFSLITDYTSYIQDEKAKPRKRSSLMPGALSAGLGALSRGRR